MNNNLATILIPMMLGSFTGSLFVGHYIKEKTKTEERAKAIGIHSQLGSIKKIYDPKDFNRDGQLDYRVNFKNGRIKIYYNQGFKTHQSPQ